FLNFRNPDFLAALGRRALALHLVALARHVAATAAARIPLPATRFLNALGVAAARNFEFLVFPVATADLDGLGVVHRLADDFAAFAVAGFLDRLANVDAVGPRLRFVARLANRIAIRLALGFPNRLANGIANVAGLRLPHRLANGVADVA